MNLQRQTSEQHPAQRPLETEKQQLQRQIKHQREILERTNMKIEVYRKEFIKMMESNQRNAKRLVRNRMKLEQLVKNRNQPEYFLSVCGFMNQYMQEFMLSHDFHGMNMAQEPNPDNMSYEQLLELGESIGKVSKGISKEEFQALPRSAKVGSEHNCPICCTEFAFKQVVVFLPCKHIYHEQCIMCWLKDENTCPVCKKSVLK